MKTPLLSLLALTLLTACSVEPKEVYTSSGKKGFSVNCSGNFSTMGYCHEQAGKKCGKRGYKVIEKHVDKGASISSNKKSSYGSTIINRNMIIQCN